MQDRLAELQSIVPEAFADGRINWDILKESLEGFLEEEGTAAEHFGLSWPGKRDARRLAALPSKGTLRPSIGEGINEDTTGNIFIEGDNLEVLKLLQKSYAGRIKMIYIDPPYNTGSDFVYKDDFEEPLEDYLKKTGQSDEEGKLLTTNMKADGRFHSLWLSMMYPRLYLARQLLKNDGFIFVSIDDNEVSRLRMLMDEIFGEENFIAPFYIKVRYEGKTLVEDMVIQKLVETVLVYRKSASAKLIQEEDKYSYDKFIYKVIEKGEAKTITLGNKRVDIFEPDAYEIVEIPPSPDGLKEIWASGKILDGNSSGRFFRDYLTDRSKSDGYHILYKVYGIGNDRLNFRYFTGPKREGATKGKYYQGVPKDVLEHPDESLKQKPIENFYDMADAFGNIRLEGGVEFRSGKKPVKMLKNFMSYVVNSTENEIILDFFAGSCTTAHATLELNQEDGGNRQFICIQLPEAADNQEFSTIAEIGKERIRRVIAKLKRDNGGNLNLWPRESPEDLGFRVLKLDRSNFKSWQDYQGESIQELETLFDKIETPLVEGWRETDLLTEILLLQGFPLDSAIIPQDSFTSNNILLVDSSACAHRLFVCLDEKIADGTISQLRLNSEDVFVCLDSALTDQSKMHLADVCNLNII